LFWFCFFLFCFVLFWKGGVVETERPTLVMQENV
jgi:hypothetical protein